MGKRYYCEFCDKSFSDNPNTRKNHTKGTSHQRMRKIHYDSFRDAAVIFTDEMNKKPCRKFVQGECHFGDSCMFSHLTEERRKELENQIQAQKQNKLRKASKVDQAPSLDEWLAKRSKRLKDDSSKPGSVSPVEVPDEEHVPVFSLPLTLSGYQSLPPSVLPPTSEDMLSQPGTEWG